MWLDLGVVQTLPVALITWQLVQLVAPAWFMVVGVQATPTVWQLPQVLLVMGAVICALVPVVGRPVALVPLWQVVQLVAAVTPLWTKLVGFQAVVAWQSEHWACPVVEIWLDLPGVKPLPVALMAWQLVQLVRPV